LIASYVYTDDLIRQDRGGQKRYFIYDGHGTTSQLIDPAEGITDTYVYDAFGIQTNNTGTTANHYLYTGEQYDPNIGLYYLRARYYHQETGRFMTRDPVSGNPFEPISLHKYLYANANPVMFKDPCGTTSLIEVMVVATIVTILASVAIAYAYTCFDPVKVKMQLQSSKFVDDYCMSAGRFVPNNYYDAFGHCNVACEGTRTCGRSLTNIAGTVREIGRELGFGGSHDSFSQDINNQSAGRQFAEIKGISCYRLCRTATFTKRLDLSAPYANCWDCDKQKFTKSCGNTP
jgi:RHS repeat-associated protein